MRLIAALFGLFLTLAASKPAVAGIDDEMRDAFGNMNYTEDPRISQGVRRNVISGGSFGFRAPADTYSLWSFQRPSMRGGCGSLDIFGGSFSIISAQQIVSMLKGIASAAYAYAFKLAIRVISDAIANEMGDWFTKLLQFNGEAMNACEMGENMMAALTEDMGFQEVDGKMTWSNVDTGNASDDAEARGEGSLLQSLASIAARSYRADELIPGNLVWRAMKDTGFEHNFFYGNETLEHLMSVTGTVVACVPGETEGCNTTLGTDTENAPELSMKPYAPTMDLEDLVEGTPTSTVVRAKNVSTYTCVQPSVDECVQMREVAAQIRGMKAEIIDRMLGTATTQGLIYRWKRNIGDLTASERAMISNGGAYMQLAISLIHANEAAAGAMIREFADVMAAEIVYLSLNDYLGRMSRAASSWNNDHGAKVQELVFEAQERLSRDMEKYLTKAQEGQSKLEWYASYAKQKSPSLPVVR